MAQQPYCVKAQGKPDKDCPVSLGKPGYAAIEPLPIMGRTLQPHEYSCCGECFIGQYERKYGVKPEGVET